MNSREKRLAAALQSWSKLPHSVVGPLNQIINGRKAITARTARELEAALGSSAELWMNLETSYRLYRKGQADPEISVRARQREKGAPIGTVQRVAGKRA